MESSIAEFLIEAVLVSRLQIKKMAYLEYALCDLKCAIS